MNREDIRKQFEIFIEFPTDERSFVTTRSALLFAEHVAAMAATAERIKHQADIEKWKGAAATAEKWRGMALSKDGDGRTVQAIQAEAREWERQACEKACEAIETDRWALYKGRPPYKGTEDGRASEYTQGQSDGASDCVAAIKARSNA